MVSQVGNIIMSDEQQLPVTIDPNTIAITPANAPNPYKHRPWEPKYKKPNVPTVLNEKSCYRLAENGMQLSDIAQYFNITVNDIATNKSLMIAWNQGRAVLKQRIAYWQINAAQDGSTAMLKHLGEIYLDQKTQQQVQLTVTHSTTDHLSDDDLLKIVSTQNENDQ
jgi:hypothetical protein